MSCYVLNDTNELIDWYSLWKKDFFYSLWSWKKLELTLGLYIALVLQESDHFQYDLFMQGKLHLLPNQGPFSVFS